MIRVPDALRLAATAAAVAIALAPSPASAGFLRVPVDFPAIANAFAAAAPGDTIALAGNGGSTYFTNETFDLEIGVDLVLQGGWRIDFAVRDPSIYVSVIRDVRTAPDRPILRIDGAPRVEIDGVTLIGGRHGVRSDSGADLVFRDCVIRGQRGSLVDGGGVRLVGGSLDMERCELRTILSSASGGGGIGVSGASRVSLRDVTIGNITVGTEGGGLRVVDVPDLEVLGCRFESISALGDGGFVYLRSTSATIRDGSFAGGLASVEGGCIMLVDCPAVEIADCTFEGGDARTGGALRAMRSTFDVLRCGFVPTGARDAGGGFAFEDCTFTIVDSELAPVFVPGFSPVPERGGGVFSLRSDGTVTGTRIAGCRAIGRGGAWSQVGGDVRFEGCRFEDNVSEIYGGGVQIELGGTIELYDCLLEGNVAKFGGAVASSFTGEVTVDGCTLARNSGRSSGAAIFVDAGGRIRARDSILCRAVRGDLVFCSAADIQMERCDVWNDDTENTRGELGGSCTGLLDGNGNFSADPLFCDPTGADGWLLSAVSPCVGAAAGGGDLGWEGVGCPAPRPVSIADDSWGGVKARYRPQGGSRSR